MKNYKIIKGLLSDQTIEAAIHDIGKAIDPNGNEPIRTIAELRECYKLNKTLPNWSSKYDSFRKLPFWTLLKSDIENNSDLFPANHQFEYVTLGVRIMEYSSVRFYPLHQEWPGMEDSIIVIWIPLHKVTSESGGILVEKDVTSKRLEFIVDDNEYLILKEQDLYDNMVEPTPELNAGDALIFNDLCIHGTSPMSSDSFPRVALIARIKSNGAKQTQW